MSHPLFDLYAQWRDLSEEEGGAITGGEWKRVDRCQADKGQLREAIGETLNRLRSKAVSGGTDWSVVEKRLQPLISELLALEDRNAEWLGLQRRKAAAQDQQLRQSSRTIRQIRRTYR